MTRIRTATSLDCDDVREVCLSAFPEEERELVATLACDLLKETTSPETISLVAEANDAVIGHIAFSPAVVESNENRTGYILAPLAVKPEWQKRKIGSKLIETGMERLSTLGADHVFVYGDPKYYGKFGFAADTAADYVPPYELEYPWAWQAISFDKGDYHGSSVRVSCVGALRDPKYW